MKIGIIGGCQASGISNWTKALLDGVEVQSWHIGVGEYSSVEAVMPQLSKFDLIISQIGDQANCGPLEISQISNHFPAVIYLPTFVFSGFQPDLCEIYFDRKNFTQVSGALGPPMSAIITAAHYHKFRQDETADLFNNLVYEKLGYFDTFEASRQFAISAYKGCNMDLADAFEGWLKNGAFMYLGNHPHTRVLGTLTYHALNAAGLKPQNPESVAEPADDLALSAQWPVYPGLAARIGVPMQSHFLRTTYDTPPSEQREISLADMIHTSFEVLDRIGRDELICDSRAKSAIEILGLLIAK